MVWRLACRYAAAKERAEAAAARADELDIEVADLQRVLAAERDKFAAAARLASQQAQVRSCVVPPKGLGIRVEMQMTTRLRLCVFALNLIFLM
jgi:hypothetical protein